VTVSRLGPAIAAVLCIVAIAAALLVELPDVATGLLVLTDSLGPWTYAIVGVLVLIETAAILGVISPGETALAVGGAAAAHGAVELPLLIAVAWAAAVAGDALGFGLGRRYGRPLLVRSGPRIGLSADRLDRLEALVRRWSGAALVAGRFVGLVRAFTPFLAGASAMPLRRLAGFSLAGAGAWCAALVLAGYVLASSLENHLDAVGNIGLGLAGGLLLAWALRRRAGCPTGHRSERHGPLGGPPTSSRDRPARSRVRPPRATTLPA
jgi:membrane protein DedA with SNARE-associated domain